MSARRLLTQLHLWLGLSLGLFFSLAGLSALVLLHKEAVVEWQFPQVKVRDMPTQGPLLSMDGLLAQVRAGQESIRPVLVFVPDEPNEAYRVIYFGDMEDQRPPMMAFAHPGNGKILARVAVPKIIPFVMLELHAKLFFSRTLVGILGVLYLALLVLGLLVWWPPRLRMVIPKLRASLRLRKGARWFDIHMSVGTLTVVFLAFLAMTGVWIAFAVPLEKTLSATTGQQPRPTIPKLDRVGPPPPLANVDGLVADALHRLPGTTVREVVLPLTAANPVGVRTSRPGDHSPHGDSGVWYDPVTRQPLLLRDGAAEPIAWSVGESWMYPLHTGTMLGTPQRVIWTALAILPTLLFLSGLIMWIKKRRRKRRT